MCERAKHTLQTLKIYFSKNGDIEEYVFAVSHMLFHDKALMKNEIREHTNEKLNHLHSFAHFSGLFHYFSGSLTIFRHLSLRKSKTYSSTVRTQLKMDSGKRAALGHFVPSSRALFHSSIFHLCSTTTKSPHWQS